MKNNLVNNKNDHRVMSLCYSCFTVCSIDVNGCRLFQNCSKSSFFPFLYLLIFVVCTHTWNCAQISKYSGGEALSGKLLRCILALYDDVICLSAACTDHKCWYKHERSYKSISGTFRFTRIVTVARPPLP